MEVLKMKDAIKEPEQEAKQSKRPTPPEDRFIKEGEQLKDENKKTAEGELICVNCKRPYKWAYSIEKQEICPQCGCSEFVWGKPEPEGKDDSFLGKSISFEEKKFKFEAKYAPGTTVLSEFGDQGRIMAVTFTAMDVEPLYCVRFNAGREVLFRAIQLEEFSWPEYYWRKAHKQMEKEVKLSKEEPKDDKADIDKG